MTPPFAAELVDLIISFLHPIPLQCGNADGNFLDKNVAAAVGRCALVCRGWVPSSRRILFYRVRVGLTTACAFAKFVKRAGRCSFLPFIRELEFMDRLAEDRWMITVLPKLAKLLPLAIHTVILSVAGDNSRPKDYALPQSPFRAITHLEILSRAVDQPKLVDIVKCVASLPRLEALRFWMGDWGDTTLPDEVLRPAETLRSLDLRCHDTSPLLAWLRESSVVISTLAVYIPSHPMCRESCQCLYAARYIEDLGQSLTSLSLGFDHLVSGRYLNVSVGFLQRNTRLRSLSIRACPLQTVAFLKNIQFSTSLESITVDVTENLAPHSDW
ncbi:hypothetical protein DFH09DRAFT_1198266 [Mycena vulgaris]|nr:hypothetical protein DFH09DRAFT_1198266 [Mycena vulgaris]